MTQELRDILVIINEMVAGLDAKKERLQYVLLRSKVVVFYWFNGIDDTITSDYDCVNLLTLDLEIESYCPSYKYYSALYREDINHLNKIASRLSIIDEFLIENP